ncbi:MAG: hypothetical protein LBK22_04585 [Tannerella sp.]|nr:hypothetical protein [Tannerella sp.]
MPPIFYSFQQKERQNPVNGSRSHSIDDAARQSGNNQPAVFTVQDSPEKRYV